MAKTKKRYFVLGGITLILFLFLFFLSSIIKSYVVKNSHDLIGRKLTLDELHINYLKVQVSAHNFTLYEENKKDTFVYFNELLINYNPWKLLSNEYAVAQIKLVNPYIYISQNGDKFNFDSLIPPSDTTTTVQDTLTTETNDLKFSIRNIELVKGEFRYFDQQIDNLLKFDNLNLELPLIAWDSRSSEMGVQFSIGEQGVVKIDAEIDQQLKEYNINFGTKNIQLNSFTNYLKDYVYITELKGLLQSNIHIKGSIENVNNILVSGSTQVDSLLVTDNNGDLLVSANSIYTLLDSIDLNNMRYILDKIYIDQPYISAVLNKDLSNWEHFLTPILADTLVTENTDSIVVNAEEDHLFYRIDTFIVNKGHVLFADNTLNRPFSYNIRNIDIEMNQLTPQNNAIPLNFAMDFNNDGKYVGETRFSIENPLNLFYNAQVSDLDMHSFSPYTEYYLGYPIVTGMFNYDCLVDMTPKKLKNDNHLLVSEPQFGKKTKDTTAYKLPLKLALYLIKDANDNVEFVLPVNGNPSEPGFKLAPLVWKTFGKFIAKTATQPFASLAKLVGTHPEELEWIRFEYTQDSLMQEQRKVLDKVTHILSKKENLVFSFRQESVIDNEIKLLAEKIVKQNYITSKLPNSPMGWKEVKDKDEKFVEYLNLQSPETAVIEAKERYAKMTPKAELNELFKSMYNKRNQLVYDYLTTTKGCKTSAIKTLNVDFNNMPQELKKPGFRVEVSVE